MTLRECFYVQTAFGACLFPRPGVLGVQGILELQPWAKALSALGCTAMGIAAWVMPGSQTRTPPVPCFLHPHTTQLFQVGKLHA